MKKGCQVEITQYGTVLSSNPDGKICKPICQRLILFFVFPYLKPGGGGGGYSSEFPGEGVPPGSSNPDPISDLNMPFSTPVFRPDL